MNKYFNNNREGHTYMFVKIIRDIPYFEDSEDESVAVPENDGYVYFRVISNHFLRGKIFRMESKDFHKRFDNERASTDSNMKTEDKKTVYNSKEWLFYDKVKWWNNNIHEVNGCCERRDEMEYIDLYNNICEEYCHKFHVKQIDFMADRRFFDDMLAEVHIDSKGKITTYKKSVNKPLRHRACCVCGEVPSKYKELPSGKIICDGCDNMKMSDAELEGCS